MAGSEKPGRFTRLTRQYELDIITRQNEAAPRRPISKISIQNFEKVENLNSRIWKIVVQGIHITKYLRICNPSREWQTFQIQIGRLGAGSYWGVKYLILIPTTEKFTNSIFGQ